MKKIKVTVKQQEASAFQALKQHYLSLTDEFYCIRMTAAELLLLASTYDEYGGKEQDMVFDILSNRILFLSESVNALHDQMVFHVLQEE